MMGCSSFTESTVRRIICIDMLHGLVSTSAEGTKSKSD